MDLATVKAAVKKWEKSFRLREGRDPTKEDIKKDASDIAIQYSLYRKLMKASASSSQPQPQSQKLSLHPTSSSTVTAPSSSSSSSQYRSTPRNIPSSEYPTTPTPPSRRSNESFFTNSQAGPSRSRSTDIGNVNGKDATGNGNGKVNDGKSLKRKASKATFSSSSPPQSHPIPQSSSSSSTSKSRTLFNTPKKRGYIGPIHDPNPINPFSITSPSKSPFPPSSTSTAGLQREKSFSSPFIHASSPKKLKEVLEANSLKKVKERTDINERSGNGLMEITPRTRARKRLKGEQVEDTPLKDKLPKKRRGQGYGQGRFSEEPLEDGLQSQRDRLDEPGRSRFDNKGIFDEEHFEDEDEDENDELGPSPMKPFGGKGRGFTSLFGEQEPLSDEDDIPFSVDKGGLPQKNGLGGKSKVNAAMDRRKSSVKEVKKGKQSEMMMSFFGRTGKSTLPIKKQDIAKPVEDQTTASASTSASSIPIHNIPSIQIQHSPPPLLGPTPSTDEIPLIDASIVPASPPASALPMSPEHTPSASQQRREKILNLSDDEIDEWDPEGGYVKREIRIVPTRRAVRRRNSSDLSDDDKEVHVAEHDNEGDEGEEEDDGVGQHSGESTEEIHIPIKENPLSPNSASSSIPMLHLLSIQSPSGAKSKAQLNKAKLDELKVKAIFNPIEATKLKAIKRGQDISFTGETRTEDDNEFEENDLLENFNLTVGDPHHGENRVGVEDEDGDEGEGMHELEDDDWESESDGWKREQLEEDW